jgi:hypothetical protein
MRWFILRTKLDFCYIRVWACGNQVTGKEIVEVGDKRTLTGKKIDCNHKWNRVNIFKLEGKYYHCRRCNNVIDDYYSRLKKNN